MNDPITLREGTFNLRGGKMRGKSVVWDHFNCEEDEGQVPSPTGGKTRPAAYCSYCNLKYTFPNATKMMRHLLKCTLCPDDTKRELEQSGFGEYRSDHSAAAFNGSSHHEDDLMPSSAMVRQMMPPIFKENDSPTPGTSAMSPHSGGFLVLSNQPSRSVDHHVDMRAEVVNSDVGRLDKQDHDQDQVSATDRALARAIFSVDVPLGIIQNRHWRELFQLLQPSYSLPTIGALTGVLLDDEYMATLERVSAEINKTRFATVLAHSKPCGGNTQGDTDGQVNLILTTPKSVFLGCMEAGQQQSPSVVAEVIEGVIAKVDPAQVLLVVTDLKQNVRDAWPIISSRFPTTTLAGSPIQGLLLLLRTFLAQDSVRRMVKNTNRVCEYRNRLIDRDGAVCSSSVKVSCTCSEDNSLRSETMLALETIMECKDTLQERVVTKTVDSDTEDIVLSKTHWDLLCLVVTTWRTVHLSISNLEKAESRLSDVAVEMDNVDKFLRDSLEHSTLSADETAEILRVFDDIQAACCTEVHKSTCLVDPRYRGNCLTEGATNDAIQYVVELAKELGQDVGRVLANLAEYRAREGALWSKPYVWDVCARVSPVTWWKGICDKQPMSTIAVGLLGLPATSPSSSISLSNLEKGSEKLSRDQTQKIMFVRANSELRPPAPGSQPNMILLG